jgi:hypothetical protein
MSKKLKRILDHVQLFTGGGAKSGSNLMIFASMIAFQMFIPRRHIRAYIWLFSNDGRKSSRTRRRQLHVFTPIRASCSIGQFGLSAAIRCSRPQCLLCGTNQIFAGAAIADAAFPRRRCRKFSVV